MDIRLGANCISIAAPTNILNQVVQKHDYWHPVSLGFARSWLSLSAKVLWLRVAHIVAQHTHNRSQDNAPYCTPAYAAAIDATSSNLL